MATGRYTPPQLCGDELTHPPPVMQHAPVHDRGTHVAAAIVAPAHVPGNTTVHTPPASQQAIDGQLLGAVHAMPFPRYVPVTVWQPAAVSVEQTPAAQHAPVGSPHGLGLQTVESP